MKKLLTILLFTILSFSANADIILKYGIVTSDNDEPHNVTWAGVWAETNNCSECIALFAVETYRANEDNPRDRLVGVDYVIKFLENNSGAVRTNFGFAIADNGGLQDGEIFNFHFGASMELKAAKNYSLMISYDHFSNGNRLFDRNHIAVNNPLDLMSIGLVF